MLRRPTTSPLFPYTTLFRSIWREYFQLFIRDGKFTQAAQVADRAVKAAPQDPSLTALADQARTVNPASGDLNADAILRALRSEEHTSELQSHHDLVCRLLLE